MTLLSWLYWAVAAVFIFWGVLIFAVIIIGGLAQAINEMDDDLVVAIKFLVPALIILGWLLG